MCGTADLIAGSFVLREVHQIQFAQAVGHTVISDELFWKTMQPHISSYLVYKWWGFSPQAVLMQQIIANMGSAHWRLRSHCSVFHKQQVLITFVVMLSLNSAAETKIILS